MLGAGQWVTGTLGGNPGFTTAPSWMASVPSTILPPPTLHSHLWPHSLPYAMRPPAIGTLHVPVTLPGTLFPQAFLASFLPHSKDPGFW